MRAPGVLRRLRGCFDAPAQTLCLCLHAAELQRLWWHASTDMADIAMGQPGFGSSGSEGLRMGE